MKRKILIPTDFSKNAWNAVTFASDLFKHQECIFYLLNAYSTSGYSTGDLMVPEPGTKSYDNAQTVSENGLAKIMDMLDFREDNPKHEYRTLSEFNDPLSAMRNVIEKVDIELVIMGTKGASNKRGVLFGSNAIMAMEKLRNCPVMGIPENARVPKVKEIVFPTSYKTHYKRKELKYLIDIAQLQDATICVLHANPRDEMSQSQEDNKQLLTECLEGANVAFHHLHASDPVQAVQIFVESRDSDMIAFINKKHAFFGSVFTSPMVKELGMFSKVPLLVMHDMRN
ncbi:universal stress protein [Dokdonia sinensis]|uniref:Universal stress protein n=1 Tax=Dokdonia sinensis TaxID=2479847 RepID=A0A3M0GHF9_9FLAO|nr:universal stress protein [Dokdonia sinensis]RMB64104.1 universal stress protein [Dokdonia sinensis]